MSPYEARFDATDNIWVVVDLHGFTGEFVVGPEAEARIIESALNRYPIIDRCCRDVLTGAGREASFANHLATVHHIDVSWPAGSGGPPASG